MRKSFLNSRDQPKGSLPPPLLSPRHSPFTPPSLPSLTPAAQAGPSFCEVFCRDAASPVWSLGPSARLPRRWALPPWSILLPCLPPGCQPAACPWPNSTWKPPRPRTGSGTGLPGREGSAPSRFGHGRPSRCYLLPSLCNTEFVFSYLVCSCFDGRKHRISCRLMEENILTVD